MEFEVLSAEEVAALTPAQQKHYMKQYEAHKAAQLEKTIEEKGNKLLEEAKEQLKKEHEAEIQALKDEIKVIKDEAEKANTDLEAYKAENNRIREAAITNANNGRKFDVALNEAIEESKDDLKKLQNDKHAKVKVTLKAVGDMGISNIQDIQMANAQLAPGIYGLPNRRIHMRNILSTGRMTTSDYHYLREVGGEGDVSPWTENSGKKQQIDLDYIEKIAPSQYIAGYVNISRKALDDVTALRSSLAGRLSEKYLVAEDNQVLNGNGTPPQLEGILQVATPYDEGNGYTRLVQRMIDAAGQLEEGTGGLTEGFFADGYILKPRDWALIANTVSNGPEQVFTLPGLGIVSMSNGILYLNGVPVYKMNGMPNDPSRQFLVGDWTMGAQLLIREDPTVEFSYENEDNFVQNKITVRVEGRVALPIYYSEAFVKGGITPATT